jgi:hypothetical protein
MSKITSLIANLLLKKRDYRSETTDFISDLKRARPELDEQQRAGRALLWDKNVDREHLADSSAARVKQGAYVYGTKSA